MAKATKEPENRSQVIDVTDPKSGNAILAAWPGIFHFFGGRVTKWVVTEDGIIVEGFSTDEKYDPEQIAKDISHRDRRLDLIPAYFIIQGRDPEPFTDPKQMTAWMVQYFRNSVEEGTSRAPRYVRDGVQAYKNEHNLAKKRGPKKKTFRVDNLGEVDKEAFKDVKLSELERLKKLIEETMASNSENSTSQSAESNETPEGDLLPA